MKPHERIKLEMSLKLFIHSLSTKKNIFQISILKMCCTRTPSSYHLAIKKINAAWRGYRTTEKLLQQNVILKRRNFPFA